jgi:hypothetical protein
MKAIGAMIVAGVMFLSGCALLEQVEQSPLASHIAVQQATLRYIDGDVEKAQRVVAVAEQVKEYASGTVTVALLTTYLRAQIKWEQLAVADVMLLDALLLELESRLVERMGEGELSPEDLANVEKVVDWVILYASMEL